MEHPAVHAELFRHMFGGTTARGKLQPDEFTHLVGYAGVGAGQQRFEMLAGIARERVRRQII